MDLKSLILSFVASVLVIADICLALLLSITLPKYLTHRNYYPTDWNLTAAEKEYYCPCSKSRGNGSNLTKAQPLSTDLELKCDEKVREAGGYYNVGKDPAVVLSVRSSDEAFPSEDFHGAIITKGLFLTSSMTIRSLIEMRNKVIEENRLRNKPSHLLKSTMWFLKNTKIYNEANNETVGDVLQLASKSDQKYISKGLWSIAFKSTMKVDEEVYYNVSNDDGDWQQVLHIVGNRQTKPAWFSIYNTCTKNTDNAIFMLCVNGIFSMENESPVYIFATNCTKQITIVGVGVPVGHPDLNNRNAKHGRRIWAKTCKTPLYEYDYEKCPNEDKCYC